jgi:hypothetical protein
MRDAVSLLRPSGVCIICCKRAFALSGVETFGAGSRGGLGLGFQNSSGNGIGILPMG